MAPNGNNSFLLQMMTLLSLGTQTPRTLPLKDIMDQTINASYLIKLLTLISSLPSLSYPIQ